MWRFALLMVLCVLAASPVWADDCSPDTCIPPSPTPEIQLMWTLPASVNDQGTPEPEQDVVFVYEVNAGDVAISILEALIFFLLAGLSVVFFLSRRKA